MSRISIIIADDHPLFRSGTRNVIQSAADQIYLLGEASDGHQAMDLIETFKPDIALLDIEMPGLNGIEICKEVMIQKSQTKIILLTMHKERMYYELAVQNNVCGYILKDRAVEELLDCIYKVHHGEKYISPDLESHLIDAKPILSHQQRELISQLTATESVILKLIGEGKTSSEIASLLFVSVKTIESHRNNLNKKLQLDGSKNALLKFAILYIS